MKKAKKLNKDDRNEIYILLNKGYSKRDIAKALNRSPNTISYEIIKNSTNGIYDANKAETKARFSLRKRRLQWSKIEENKEIKNFVIDGLKNNWNPDEIAGRLKLKNKDLYVSKTAIYEWLRSIWGQQYCKYLYSGRYYKKRSKLRLRKVMIKDRTSIDKRSDGANNRSRYGHWEKDSVCSVKGDKTTLAVMTERKSRILLASKVNGYSPYLHNLNIIKMSQGKKVLSITYDNGIENGRHKDINIPSFFCDPYSSWQKGSVENANKLIRKFLPKGTVLSKVKPEYLEEIVNSINNKPRKILNYKTALEVARENGVLLDEEVS